MPSWASSRRSVGISAVSQSVSTVKVFKVSRISFVLLISETISPSPMIAIVSPFFTLSPFSTRISVICPVTVDVIVETPPLLIRMPEVSTLSGIVPKMPQMMAQARTIPIVMIMSHPRGEVTVISLSSCSGEDNLSSDVFLNILFDTLHSPFSYK